MTTNTKQGRLLIDIIPSDLPDRFDILLNGFSYRIHRGLTDVAAIERAAECKHFAYKQGQRAAIVMTTRGAA